MNRARCVESTGAQLIGEWTIDFDESWRIGVASHIRQEAKRKAVAALDHVTITSQLGNWKINDDDWKRLELKQTKGFIMVGTGRFKLPEARLEPSIPLATKLASFAAANDGSGRSASAVVYGRSQ